MAQPNREQLIELVTREVYRILGEPDAPAPDPSGLPKALAAGSPDALPAPVRKKYRFLGMESYTGPESITGFEAVFLTSLSLTELSDIAQGRDTRPVPCAVIAALMEGVPVYLAQSALAWRKKKARMSPGFYQLLEGHVRALQHFGVLLLDGGTASTGEGRKFAPGADLPDGVITEAMAHALAEKSTEPILLVKKGTVLTPSARDVFLHAGIEIRIV
ncbi:MAG: hypothetical protein SOX72_05715 [Oscillospiraceae bacterium]|nr:hypothetical protein [Oscillospiraceae bacterium]